MGLRIPDTRACLCACVCVCVCVCREILFPGVCERERYLNGPNFSVVQLSKCDSVTASALACYAEDPGLKPGVGDELIVRSSSLCFGLCGSRVGNDCGKIERIDKLRQQAKKRHDKADSLP